MTIDNLMHVDPEPPSSQCPILECDPPPSSARVRWSHSNPESLLLKQQLKDGPVQPQPDVFVRPRASLHHHPDLDLVNPLPSDHPAKAKKFELRQEDSPSMPQHIDELHSAVDKMNGKVKRNARQKAHKDRRDSTRLDPDSLFTNLTTKSEQPVINPLRREHSFQGAIPPPPSDKPSRLPARASESDIAAIRASGENGPRRTPFLGTSRHVSHPILNTLRKPMDIDWDNIPSNTPTPPCRRRRNRSSVDSCSSKYNYDSQASSSSSSAMSPLTIHPRSHSPLYSHDDDASMTDQGTAVSPVDPPNNSPVAPHEILPMPGQLSPEVPSPPALMPPPPPFFSARPNPPPARLTQPTPAPAPTPTPAPPSLSRPFAPPSQMRPTQTQSARPRASQRPRPLGMCRALGQTSTSAGVNKPYKLPLPTRVKKTPAPVPHRPERYAEGAGDSTTPFSVDDGNGRRSMSPVIPDPPHIVARAQTLGSQLQVLEMSARRPEPRGDEDGDDKDANSSADLWACFD